MKWQRKPELDKRFKHGDDYAGDAWQNIETGEIRYVAVGVCAEFKQRKKRVRGRK
jgi:hypothetical protein